MGMRRAALLSLLMVGSMVGCQESGDDGITVDATGTVLGVAGIDRNGNGVLEPVDAPAPDVRVELRGPVGTRTLYATETGPRGEFSFSDVLVGDYTVAVDSASVGDTLQVLRIDSAAATVSAGDTTTVLVALSFPVVTVDSARATRPERRVLVEGRVISEWNTFGDGSLHVRDSTGALRAVRVQATAVAAGDSIRLLGTTSLQAGRPVLKDAAAFLVETGVESPPPVPITTGVTSGADGGRLDAELVRIEGAVVRDTLRNSFGERIFRVNDGSGRADVVLDRNIAFFTDFPPGGDLIGAVMDATGVLVPAASGAAGSWVLKPRASPDITLRP